VRSDVTEELVAMQVEPEPLKEPSDVNDTVAPSLEDLHAVVEPLDKSARLAILEVVRNLVHPPVDRPKKTLELGQPTYTHPLVPGPHGALGCGLCIVALEQLCQVFPQVVGLLERWRQGEDPLEQLPLLGLEIRRPLAKWPHRPLDLGVLGWGQCALEPLDLLLAHRVGAITVRPRHVDPIDDDLGPRHLRFDCPHEAFVHICARALACVPKRLGDRAQEGRHGLLLAVPEPRQDVDASPRPGRRHQHDEITVPALERDLVDADHPQPLPGAPVNCARNPAVEDALARLLRDAELAGRVRDRRVDQHAQGPWLVRLGVGAAGLVPLARLRRRGVARAVWASIPLGPNLDKDGNIEQGQMTQAHGRIPPMKVANLPTAPVTLGAFEGALDADEPVPLLGPLRREDTHIGQVQRHLNKVVHGDSSPREPVPLSSHRDAPSLYDIGRPITAIPGEPFISRYGLKKVGELITEETNATIAYFLIHNR
jgi:hypothetical protein